jgi:hypothetical protein
MAEKDIFSRANEKKSLPEVTDIKGLTDCYDENLKEGSL